MSLQRAPAPGGTHAHSTVSGQVNDVQTVIASAVEEQTATPDEVSRSVAEAAASELSQLAGDLAGLVGRSRV